MNGFKRITEEHQTKMVAKSLNLDDAEIEESKRDLITREIGKFREVMKVIIFTIYFNTLLLMSFLLFCPSFWSYCRI